MAMVLMDAEIYSVLLHSSPNHSDSTASLQLMRQKSSVSIETMFCYVDGGYLSPQARLWERASTALSTVSRKPFARVMEGPFFFPSPLISFFSPSYRPSFFSYPFSQDSFFLPSSYPLSSCCFLLLLAASCFFLLLLAACFFFLLLLASSCCLLLLLLASSSSSSSSSCFLFSFFF